MKHYSNSVFTIQLLYLKTYISKLSFHNLVFTPNLFGKKIGFRFHHQNSTFNSNMWSPRFRIHLSLPAWTLSPHSFFFLLSSSLVISFSFLEMRSHKSSQNSTNNKFPQQENYRTTNKKLKLLPSLSFIKPRAANHQTQKICINFATRGYAVFVADLLDHGRYDNLRCYLGNKKF